MRIIERSSAFKRDYKRIKANLHHSKDIDLLLSRIITDILSDKPLPDKNHDHALSGNWLKYRECHVKPDLLLIYRRLENNHLRLARLGSHSELFG